MVFLLGLVFKELISMRTMCVPFLELYLKPAEIQQDFYFTQKVFIEQLPCARHCARC